MSSSLLSKIISNRSLAHVEMGTVQLLVHVAVLLAVESQRSLGKRWRHRKKRGMLEMKRRKNLSGVAVVVVEAVAIMAALILY